MFGMEYDGAKSVDTFPRNPVAPRDIEFSSDFFKSFIPQEK